MSGNPTVTVVVVNWNRCDLLESCLTSLESQTYRDFETIVIDNGSTDGSRDLLNSLASPGLRWVANEENQGFCAANNQGIKLAHGHYIALLNNDAEATPDWLAELTAAAEADGRVGMVASKILSYENRRVIDKVGHLIYPDGQNRGRGTGEEDTGQYDGDPDVAWPDGCAALYRREMLDEIGGFDEDFFAYADDAELGLRGRLAGWKAVYAPSAVVYHRVGSTLGRYSPRRLFLIERNRIWLVAKLFPLRLWPASPIYFFLRVGGAAFALLHRSGESHRAASQTSPFTLLKCLIRANWAGLAGLPKMLRKRAQVRDISRLSPAEAAQLIRKYRVRLRDLTFKTH